MERDDRYWNFRDKVWKAEHNLLSLIINLKSESNLDMYPIFNDIENRIRQEFNSLGREESE